MVRSGRASYTAKGQDFFTVSVEEIGRVFETNLVWNFMIVRQAAIAICGKRIYNDQKSMDNNICHKQFRR